MKKRRVVVTGLGIVSPVGNSVGQVWSNLVAGRSGVETITRFDPSPFQSQIAGEVKNFDVTEYITAKEARRTGRFVHYGVGAGVQAIRDADIDANSVDLNRVGLAIGSAIGGLPSIESTVTEFNEGGMKKVSPFFIPGMLINMVSAHLSMMYGFGGPSLSYATACTAGSHAIGEGARTIERGDADVMLVGASESSISKIGVAGYCVAHALSTRNDDPHAASRPWDRARDGFVIAEGAGMMVLEERDHAIARGAKIYAELVGYGCSSDAFHVTQPHPTGDGARRCMAAAIRDAGITPSDVQYVNAHATATKLGDEAETRAIKDVFGASPSNLIVNSTKSITGHMQGAAGGAEGVFTVLALYHQISPPTINLDDPDDGCDLDYCPNMHRDVRIDHALSNSFGFGGTNASVIFARA